MSQSYKTSRRSFPWLQHRTLAEVEETEKLKRAASGVGFKNSARPFERHWRKRLKELLEKELEHNPQPDRPQPDGPPKSVA